MKKKPSKIVKYLFLFAVLCSIVFLNHSLRINTIGNTILKKIELKVGDFSRSNHFQKPNVVIILADDLGWNDVGYHGSDIKTPNIDFLAKTSVEFNRFYTYHSCTPTRAGLLTGRYPRRMGLNHILYPNRKGGLAPDETTLAEILTKVGYTRRACIGKWHLGHSDIRYHPLNQGFSYFYGCYGGLVDYFTHKNAGQLDWHKDFDICLDNGYVTDLISNEAVNFIQNSSEEAPFFLYIPYNAPHSPLQAPEKYLNMCGFDKNKPIYSDPSVFSENIKYPYQLGQGNTKRQTYAAMVTAMDIGIGRIYKALEEKGVLENTFLLFMSDNGGISKYGGSNDPLKGHKGQSFEGGIRVPAILHYPRLIPQKKVVEDVVSYVDIVHTICNLLNIEKPSNKPLDGISLLPVLQQEEPSKAHKERMLFIGSMAVMKGNWKLVYEELFDIGIDIREQNNLADTEVEVKEFLMDTLQAFNSSIENKKNIDDSYVVPQGWQMPFGN